MTTTQTIIKTPPVPYNGFFYASPKADYLWKNLKIEKHSSKNWLYKMYKGSLVNDFWLMVTSPTG